jgi:hypothetical protein
MRIAQGIKSWWLARQAEEADAWKAETPAWLSSLTFHALILAIMALVAVADPQPADLLTLIIEPETADDPLTETQELTTSDIPREEVGSTGSGIADAIATAGPMLAATAMEPTQPVVESTAPRTVERVTIQDEIRVATGPRFADNLVIKGAAGVGATGAVGAVDRITQEILLSLEQRRTLVVWFFDQSGSLARQRAEIIQRFDRIYEELGVLEAAGNPAFKKHEAKPLLSAVVAFGQNVSFLTAKPTDDLAEIKSAVSGLKTDESGIERTFQAINQAAARYKSFRTQEPRRNVLFVVFTDEVGDDESELDSAVAICRHHAIPVYCIGVPAPFGRRDAAIKYVDPDPKYDQTPQWVSVRQGPESYLPELVNIGSEQSDEPMDSGFGPYSLTRLCYETGGIFFAVHPNRDERHAVSRRDTAVLSSQLTYFFDPQVMLNYRPDYVSIKDYKKLLAENKARRALVEAAQMSWLAPMERPQLVFPKLNDADLVNRLTQAQHAAAVLEPKIDRLYQTLKTGETDRRRLTRPRWQAGYDLSMGRVMALKVRTESYNAMLAKAKQGMRFADSKNDTWQLVASADLNVGSTLGKLAEQGRTYLERVVHDHPGTPWALLAEKELKQPFGWQWKETFTGVSSPPRVAAGGGNNRPRPPQNEKPNMLPRPERRAPPKL